MLRLQHKLSTFDHTSAHAKSNRLKGDECMLKAQHRDQNSRNLHPCAANFHHYFTLSFPSGIKVHEGSHYNNYLRLELLNPQWH